MNNIKKYIYLLLLLSLMCMSMSITGYANNIDCKDIPEEYKNMVCENGTSDVLRYYNGAYLNGFAEGRTIEEMTGDKYTLEEILITYSGNDINSALVYSMKSGVPTILGDAINFGSAFFIENTSDSAIRKIERQLGTEINKTICLSGASSKDGIYICYETEKGIYVLFKEHQSSSEMYLFPIEDFSTYAHEYQIELKKNLYSEDGSIRAGGGYKFSDLSGVDKYLINSDNTVKVLIPVSLIVMAGITLFIVIKKGQKQNNNS